MKINKKTAFDWRHKNLSSLEQDSGKGNKQLKRLGRKPGSSSGEKKKRGVSDNKAAVIDNRR